MSLLETCNMRSGYYDIVVNKGLQVTGLHAGVRENDLHTLRYILPTISIWALHIFLLLFLLLLLLFLLLQGAPHDEAFLLLGRQPDSLPLPLLLSESKLLHTKARQALIAPSPLFKYWDGRGRRAKSWGVGDFLRRQLGRRERVEMASDGGACAKRGRRWLVDEGPVSGVG